MRCVAPDFDWTDLGGWLALEPFLEQLEESHMGATGQPGVPGQHRILRGPAGTRGAPGV